MVKKLINKINNNLQPIVTKQRQLYTKVKKLYITVDFDLFISSLKKKQLYRVCNGYQLLKKSIEINFH